MSYNFTFKELIKSDYAAAHKINNMPTKIEIIDNMFYLITECLQPMRTLFGKPFVISSGYRCEKVNTGVGGSTTSHHLTGQAVDFVVNGFTPKEIFDWIRKGNFNYTQLILEYSKGKTWVHVSYDRKNVKKENLIYQNGKYIKV